MQVEPPDVPVKEQCPSSKIPLRHNSPTTALASSIHHLRSTSPEVARNLISASHPSTIQCSYHNPLMLLLPWRGTPIFLLWDNERRRPCKTKTTNREVNCEKSREESTRAMKSTMGQVCLGSTMSIHMYSDEIEELVCIDWGSQKQQGFLS